MPTPTKPFTVLSNEKKSHRTKAELSQRMKAEKDLLTGVALKERPEVRTNPSAHKEFKRINNLLKNIDKNDAIYEGVINRYCIIFSECMEMENRREEIYGLVQELRKIFKETVEGLSSTEKADRLLDFSKEMAKLSTTMINLDKAIQSKRKMLLDIEKENIMTVASALRSVPKKTEDQKDPNASMFGD